MIKKSKIILSSLAILLVAAVFVFAFSASPSVTEDNENNAALQYHAQQCIKIDRLDGTTFNSGCSENTLTTAGSNLIKDYLGQGGTVEAVKYIALCNATAGCSAAAVGSTTLNNEYAAGGLSRAAGTYSSNGNGNWSITKVFTATADGLYFNKTGIFNASSGGTLFAENTFVLSLANTGDNVTDTWTIWVTEA